MEKSRTQAGNRSSREALALGEELGALGSGLALGRRRPRVRLALLLGHHGHGELGRLGLLPRDAAGNAKGGRRLSDDRLVALADAVEHSLVAGDVATLGGGVYKGAQVGGQPRAHRVEGGRQPQARIDAVQHPLWLHVLDAQQAAADGRAVRHPVGDRREQRLPGGGRRRRCRRVTRLLRGRHGLIVSGDVVLGYHLGGATRQEGKLQLGDGRFAAKNDNGAGKDLVRHRNRRAGGRPVARLDGHARRLISATVGRGDGGRGGSAHGSSGRITGRRDGRHDLIGARPTLLVVLLLGDCRGNHIGKARLSSGNRVF